MQIPASVQARAVPRPARHGSDAQSVPPDSADLGTSADQAAALLKALSSRDRLMLLCQLVDGERHVGELGTLAGIGQPSLSQQLGVLRGEGLVATRRQGRRVVYRLASPAALAVLGTLCELFKPKPAVPSGASRSRTPRGHPPGITKEIE